MWNSVSEKKWKCMEIHTDSFEQLDKLIRGIVCLMKESKGKHLDLYFFNKYTNPKKNEYFIKLGLVNSDEKALSDLDALLREHKARKVPYECEMKEVGGVPIDFIKCVSCELLEKIRETVNEKPTLEQLGYLLHFLMNQLGLGYENELRLYKCLENGIEKQLKDK